MRALKTKVVIAYDNFFYLSERGTILWHFYEVKYGVLDFWYFLMGSKYDTIPGKTSYTITLRQLSVTQYDFMSKGEHG